MRVARCWATASLAPMNLGAGFARKPIRSKSRSNDSRGVLWRRFSEVGPNGVVVFRPKGPAVHIAWPSGPGKSPPNHRSGPTGRQFMSSAPRMAGPLGLKIFFCSRAWPSRPGYWNGWPFGPEMHWSGRLNSSQQSNAFNVC